MSKLQPGDKVCVTASFLRNHSEDPNQVLVQFEELRFPVRRTAFVSRQSIIILPEPNDGHE